MKHVCDSMTLQPLLCFQIRLINIQDPFELSYNTAKGVNDNMVSWFKQCLAEAWLNRSLFQPACGTLWGLQHLFQHMDQPKKSKKSQNMNLVTQADECLLLKHCPAGTTTGDNHFEKSIVELTKPLEMRGLGKRIVLNLPSPDNLCDQLRSAEKYVEVCCQICELLPSVFGMDVEAPVCEHPVSDSLSGKPGRHKRRNNSDANQAEALAKKRKTGSSDNVPGWYTISKRVVIYKRNCITCIKTCSSRLTLHH